MAKMRKTIFNSSPLLKGKTTPFIGKGARGFRQKAIRRLAMTTLGILAIALLANFGLNTKNAEAAWSPGDWINADFWAGNPSDGNIIYALYGDGTPGSSPYIKYWTGVCTPDTVVRIPSDQPFSILNNPNANTIYLIQSDDYPIPNPGNIIKPANCSAIIGLGDVTFTKEGSLAAINLDGVSNVIIDNIKVDGGNDISIQNQGIKLTDSDNNTINNVEVYENMGSAASAYGIHLDGSTHNTINRARVHDNDKYGIYLEDGSNNNYILDSQIYNHTDSSDAGIMIEDDSKYNVINNTHVYNNDAGIKMKGSSSGSLAYLNSINNSQVYNNAIGVFFYGNYVHENIINNSNIYNNEYGFIHEALTLPTGVATGSIGVVTPSFTYMDYLYKSFEDKVESQYKINPTYADFHDNTTGVFIELRSAYTYMNDSSFYNNNVGIQLNQTLIYPGSSSSIEYFGDNKFFDNGTNRVGGATLYDQGSSSNLLGWDEGSLVDDTETISKYWITNPINANGTKLITDFTNRTNNRGTGTRTSAEPTKYVIGKNVSKQIEPVRWIDDGIGVYPETFGIFGKDYDTEKYIAEVQMQLSAEDEALVEYYYGDESEFTVNWNENNCSLGAFTVEYINSYSELSSNLISNDPIGHTIYVLSGIDYNLTTGINITDNCIAIVSQSTGALLYPSTSFGADALIYANGQENIILDKLTINGRGNIDYGIVLDREDPNVALNNTLNEIKSSNNNIDGILLGMGSKYNTIMNSQVWNNDKYGIEIYYAGEYNVVNNSLSYNNSEYGLRFGNGSKYNTINNSQFFNNGIGGVFADFTTQQNLVNNVHLYNNTNYGLNFKRSSGNTINDIYSYNNNIGINMTDDSCINNTYNGDLVLFNNSGGNFYGTDGMDDYLDTGAPAVSSWDGGIPYIDENTMTCDWATNPRYIGTYSTGTWLLSGGYNCADIGPQSLWSSHFEGYGIDYMFGSYISEQKQPVGYSGTTIVEIDNKLNTGNYVGEMNPIIWTDPVTIDLYVVESIGARDNLDPETIYEITVDYGTSMINHNFDVMLTLDPITTTGSIQVMTGSTRVDVGIGATDLPYDSTEIRLVITTLSGYYQTITGELYIGTTEYGSLTETFTLTTKSDPTPPTIAWTDNVAAGGIWEGESNNWQATTTGIYTINTYAQYVTGASDCNSGVIAPYAGTVQDIASYPGDLDGMYVCVYVEDTVNGQVTTGLSNQIKTTNLEFDDDVATGPVYYDVIDINFQNTQNYGYRRVTTGSECGTGLSGLTFTSYTSPIVLNSDTSFNGKYICAYGEDSTGSGKYVLSANDMNISDYGDTVNFVDDVEETWVATDTIEVYFSSLVTFDQKLYKRVDSLVDCTDTGSMAAYTGSITLTDDTLNGKYFCLYSREQGTAIENYLISLNPVQIDIMDPTTPIIETPVAGEDVTFLIVETYGASDGESGLTGFEYEIAENATFLDVIQDGIYYTTGTDVIPEFDENNEQTYAIRVRAVDAVGNTSDRSSSVEFDYQELSNFEFEDEDNAEPGEAYMSNEITMDGLDDNETITATVTYGVLYRNGDPKGSSTLVQNDDELAIEMFASEDYDEDVETELIIANRSIPWEIRTMNEEDEDDLDCDLSTSQQLAVASVFNSILDIYEGSQLSSFLITMQSMLEDNIDLASDDDNACNMDYLLDMIDDELDEDSNASNTHIAPNCKEYSVDYSSSKEAYYSPDMMVRTYFGSRDELGKYLDSKNPGDCHVNTYGDTVSYDNTDPNRHIALNGKVYDIESSDIGYTSPDFTYVKYFASLTELRNYIDRNNPAVLVWDHEVDAEFEPITHTAPNGKTYKIYKTNRGYMSYKLLSVRYYGSLEELTGYIDRNNG